jgi:adenine deaminase
MQVLRDKATKITWMYEPTVTEIWKPGFPETLMFATLTCAPWRWVLVAPSTAAPTGFVNVQTGETRPVVW